MCSEEIICLLVDLSNLVKFLFAFRLAFPASISIYVETRGKAEGTREKCVMLETIAECFSFFRWLKCRGGATEWVTGEVCIYLPLTILINAFCYCAKSNMHHANNWYEHKPESVLKSFKRKSVKCDGTSIYKQAKS